MQEQYEKLRRYYKPLLLFLFVVSMITRHKKLLETLRELATIEKAQILVRENKQLSATATSIVEILILIIRKFSTIPHLSSCL